VKAKTASVDRGTGLHQVVDTVADQSQRACYLHQIGQGNEQQGYACSNAKTMGFNHEVLEPALR
jgi:hypothetical protein